MRIRERLMKNQLGAGEIPETSIPVFDSTSPSSRNLMRIEKVATQSPLLNRHSMPLEVLPPLAKDVMSVSMTPQNNKRYNDSPSDQ